MLEDSLMDGKDLLGGYLIFYHRLINPMHPWCSKTN